MCGACADEHISSPDRCTASMALADLLNSQGQRQEALQALEAVKGLVDPQWELEQPQAAVALTMQRAHLFRKLGKEVYAALIMCARLCFCMAALCCSSRGCALCPAVFVKQHKHCAVGSPYSSPSS